MADIKNIGEKLVDGITGAYRKIEDKFSEKFLDEEGGLKTGKIGEAVTKGYKKIEEGVVEGYKKLEDGVVEGFSKVNDKFIEKLFSKDGESLEQTKARLSGESEEPAAGKKQAEEVPCQQDEAEECRAEE